MAAGRQQKYLVVVNPISRGGKAVQEGIWLVKHLGRLGVSHEAFFTENAGHARNVVKRWMERVDVVVAVGGDGTVNEVINGMMSVPGCDRTLAVFPAGTADDFCHNVGIPRKDRNRALEVMLSINDRRLDLIRYNDSYAAVQLGVGIDAEIAYRTLRHKKIKLLAYVYVGTRMALIERMTNSSRLMHIESDNGVYDGKFLLAVFGNAPLYGRFVYWMPDARMDDGILNMSALRPLSPIPAYYMFLRCFSKEYRNKKITYDASTRFLLEVKEEAYMQVDGEVYKYPAGETLDISVERSALRVRLPSVPPEGVPYSIT